MWLKAGFMAKITPPILDLIQIPQSDAVIVHTVSN